MAIFVLIATAAFVANRIFFIGFEPFFEQIIDCRSNDEDDNQIFNHTINLELI